jgi:hypothetical protein
VSYIGHVGDDGLIRLDPKPIRIDATWGFQFIRADGTEDQVNGFSTEEEALQWIHNGGCETWSRKMDYVCDKCMRVSKKE